MMHSVGGGTGPARFSDPAQLADAIVDKVGKRIVLALPLGLGKANHIANALYAKAVADRSISLSIFTALTLEPPRAKSDLERRFLDAQGRPGCRTSRMRTAHRQDPTERDDEQTHAYPLDVAGRLWRAANKRLPIQGGRITRRAFPPRQRALNRVLLEDHRAAAVEEDAVRG